MQTTSQPSRKINTARLYAAGSSEHYVFTGKKGSGIVANASVPELELRRGDQLIALDDERFVGTEYFIRTSLGMMPSRHFIEHGRTSIAQQKKAAQRLAYLFDHTIRVDELTYLTTLWDALKLKNGITVGLPAFIAEG